MFYRPMRPRARCPGYEAASRPSLQTLLHTHAGHQATACTRILACMASSNVARSSDRPLGVGHCLVSPQSATNRAQWHSAAQPQAKARRSAQSAPQEQLSSAAAGPLSPDGASRIISSRIKSCQDWLAVDALLLQHSEQLNHIHLSAAITHTAKLQAAALGGRSSSQLAALQQWQLHLLQQLLQHRQALLPRQISNCLGAVAQTGARPDAATTSHLLELFKSKLTAANCIDLANMLHALSVLRVEPPQDWLAAYWLVSESMLSQHGARELSNTAYAAAALQLTPPASWCQALLCSADKLLHSLLRQERAGAQQQQPAPKQQPQEDARPIQQQQQHSRRAWASRPAGDHLAPQAVVQLLWAVAALQLQPSQAWLATYMDATQLLLPRFSGREAVTLLQVAARWSQLSQGDFEPQLSSWLAAVVGRCRRQLQTLDVSTTVQLLTSLQQLLQQERLRQATQNPDGVQHQHPAVVQQQQRQEGQWEAEQQQQKEEESRLEAEQQQQQPERALRGTQHQHQHTGKHTPSLDLKGSLGSLLQAAQQQALARSKHWSLQDAVVMAGEPSAQQQLQGWWDRHGAALLQQLGATELQQPLRPSRRRLSSCGVVPEALGVHHAGLHLLWLAAKVGVCPPEPELQQLCAASVEELRSAPGWLVARSFWAASQLLRVYQQQIQHRQGDRPFVPGLPVPGGMAITGRYSSSSSSSFDGGEDAGLQAAPSTELTSAASGAGVASDPEALRRLATGLLQAGVRCQGQFTLPQLMEMASRGAQMVEVTCGLQGESLLPGDAAAAAATTSLTWTRAMWSEAARLTSLTDSCNLAQLQDALCGLQAACQALVRARGQDGVNSSARGKGSAIWGLKHQRNTSSTRRQAGGQATMLRPPNISSSSSSQLLARLPPPPQQAQQQPQQPQQQQQQQQQWPGGQAVPHPQRAPPQQPAAAAMPMPLGNSMTEGQALYSPDDLQQIEQVFACWWRRLSAAAAAQGAISVSAAAESGPAVLQGAKAAQPAALAMVSPSAPSAFDVAAVAAAAAWFGLPQPASGAGAVFQLLLLDLNRAGATPALLSNLLGWMAVSSLVPSDTGDTSYAAAEKLATCFRQQLQAASAKQLCAAFAASARLPAACLSSQQLCSRLEQVWHRLLEVVQQQQMEPHELVEQLLKLTRLQLLPPPGALAALQHYLADCALALPMQQLLPLLVLQGRWDALGTQARLQGSTYSTGDISGSSSSSSSSKQTTARQVLLAAVEAASLQHMADAWLAAQHGAAAAAAAAASGSAAVAGAAMVPVGAAATEAAALSAPASAAAAAGLPIGAVAAARSPPPPPAAAAGLPVVLEQLLVDLLRRFAVLHHHPAQLWLALNLQLWLSLVGAAAAAAGERPCRTPDPEQQQQQQQEEEEEHRTQHLHPQQQQQQQQQMRFLGHQVARLLLAYAKLGHAPAAQQVQALLRVSLPALPHMTRGQLVGCIYGLGKLRFVPPQPWLEAFYSRALTAPGQFAVPGFGQLVWGLARLAATPDPEWLHQLLNSSVKPAEVSGLTARHLALLLCAFVRLGVQLDGSWMAAFAAALQQRRGPLGELDHFHLQWAWVELNDQSQPSS